MRNPENIFLVQKKRTTESHNLIFMGQEPKKVKPKQGFRVKEVPRTNAELFARLDRSGALIGKLETGESAGI